jgi:type III pantothenate kinase
MRILAIDVGNSRVRAALWTGDEPERPAAVLAAGAGAARPLGAVLECELPTGADAQAVLGRALREAYERERCSLAALVSVVPALNTALANALPRCLRIDHTLAWPFPLDIAAPAQVGADRLCNAAGVVAAGRDDAIVVDAGTATTFDVVRGAAFVGGLIAPGMALAAEALGRRAARLSPQAFGPRPLAVERETSAAIRTGCYHVGRNGVLATLAGLKALLADPLVVFTGGLGHLLAAPGDLYDAAWTLRGAAWLAETLEDGGTGGP